MNIDDDAYFLPGVTMECDGQQYPACELMWVFYRPCGCAYGLVAVTQESVVESGAWAVLYGRKRDRDRKQKAGYTCRLRPGDEGVEFVRRDCPHPVSTCRDAS